MTLLSFIHSTESRAQWQSFEAYWVKLEPGQRLLEEWLMREKSISKKTKEKKDKRQEEKSSGDAWV